jgi:hypothetical protein
MKWWESGVRLARDEAPARDLLGELARAISARRRPAKDEEQSSESALSDVSTAMSTVPGEGGGSSSAESAPTDERLPFAGLPEAGPITSTGEFSKQLSDLGV